ncbi:MAG: hypothetical protein LQ340_002761 [Diploschistes diacapsis]|nr:MAG: hypothetical protein LQ340_002761 [Diploschistes diacapsis]
MLGRLLQSATTTFSQHGTTLSQTPLESITEETHTRDLLYPDPSTLRINPHNSFQSFAGRTPATPKDAGSFDDRGGLDITYPSDVRIIIAQDANSRHQSPQVLYDSKNPKHTALQNRVSSDEISTCSELKPATRPKSMTTQLPQTRKESTPNSCFSSSKATATSPLSPREFSKLKNFRAESGSAAPLASDTCASEVEAAQARAATDEKEDTEALLGCVFGAAGFRLEASTKLHIIPKRSADDAEAESKTPNPFRPTTSGGFPWKRAPSLRPGCVNGADGPSLGGTRIESRAIVSARPAIMFTRLFSVNLPDSTNHSGQEDLSLEEVRDVQTVTSPGTSAASTAASSQVPTHCKQKRVPMYAVTVVLQLPEENSNGKLRGKNSPVAVPAPGFSPSETFLASLWRTEHGFPPSSSSGQAGLIFDPALRFNISHILRHWKFLDRSMELLEIAVRSHIRGLLEAIRLGPIIFATPSSSGPRKSKRPKQPMQQNVYVQPGCLQDSASVRKEVTSIIQTIASGLRPRRVVTGQSRWGAWKEEARWVGKWAGSREQNFFFYVVLTAFLGSHTAWLQSLSPIWYKRQHALQQRLRSQDDNSIKQRTVIIASDKMAARRLLFLLAAFLPGSASNANPQAPIKSLTDQSNSEDSPISSTGKGQFSQGTAAKARKIHQLPESSNGHARSVSFSVIENKAVQRPSVGQDRRGSDARSIRIPSLAIPRQSHGLRKASTSTLITKPDLPVPHFTTPSTATQLVKTADQRLEGSGSLASVALTHNLKPSESTSASTSGSAIRWGSVASGFWGDRRNSSTDVSENSGVPRASATGRNVINESPSKLRPTKLARMVNEVQSSSDGGKHDQHELVAQAASGALPFKERIREPLLSGKGSLARDIPAKPKTERMPLKLSLNDEDGYLDVSLSPNGSWQSSIASSFASSWTPATVPPGFNENQNAHEPSISGALTQRSDPFIEVAGWLQSYHPGFELQAVAPYDTLLDDIRASMCADSKLASPPKSGADFGPGQWTDVCAILVADATTFTIKRLRLVRQRKVVPTSPATIEDVSACDPTSHNVKIVTEPVMDIDATLTDAIERLLTQSERTSRTHSRAPSPRPVRESLGNPGSASAEGRSRTVGLEGGSLPSSLGGSIEQVNVLSLDCQRTVIGALQEIVKGVVEERQNSGDTRGGRHVVSDSTLREGVRKWLGDVEGSARGV